MPSTSLSSAAPAATAAISRSLAGSLLYSRPVFRAALKNHAAVFSSSVFTRQPRRKQSHNLCLSSVSPSTRSISSISSPTFLPGRCRRFHSFDRSNEPLAQDRFSAAEQAILSAASKHIPEHGFTEHTIALGAYDSGYPSISTSILPEGVFSLVRWHLVTQRTALAERSREIFGETAAMPANGFSQDVALSPADVSERAERLIWERLMGNKEIVGRWQEALAIMAQPSYVAMSLRELALLADEIWALAGDTAVDPSWYMKRATVSAIYASSELFMTTDNNANADYAATREFLQRRFRESKDVGGYVRSVGEWMSFAASAGVNVLRSKGVNV